MPGVNYWDGSQFQKVAALEQSDGQTAPAYRWDGSQWVKIFPHYVVSRPEDTTTATDSRQAGVVVDVKTDLSYISWQISKETVGVTTAYIFDEADLSTPIATQDISGKSAHDVVEFNESLSSANEYALVMDADGADYTRGSTTLVSYPYTSTNIDIIAGRFDTNAGDDTSGAAYNANYIDIQVA